MPPRSGPITAFGRTHWGASVLKIIASATGLLCVGVAFAANFASGTLSIPPVTIITAPLAAKLTSSATATPNWVDCAQEGQTCNVSGTVLVRYGVGDQVVTREVTGQFVCGNALFGDPIYGVVKSCSYAAVATPAQWITCANEDQTCIVPGATQVRYGARDVFAYKEVTDKIKCSNGMFGDPVYGVAKTCAYRLTAIVTAPTPVPAPAGSGLVELASIPSNFDVNKYLVPAWGSGAIPVSNTPDVVGAFRFICNPGQVLADDPIVYPGQAGRSHLHQFFGNTAANANSTYASLRTTGESTCNNILNRSAYWIPAMMNGKGKVVRPDYVSIYYKRRPANDPECMRMATKGCRDLPRGLRYIFGYNMTTDVPGSAFYYNCDGATGTPGHYSDIVSAAKACPIGNRLGVVINGPECWDGKSLDTADHRSHMAYPDYGSWGYQKCPDTHPYVIPAFTLGAWYTTDADLDRSGQWNANKTTWRLSSDVMAGMAPKRPGTTMHADWFGAWDDDVMKMWNGNCIDKLLNCSGGDLGNGKQLRMYDGFSWDANPRLIDPPA